MTDKTYQWQDLFPLEAQKYNDKRAGKSARARQKQRIIKQRINMQHKLISGLNALAEGGLLDPWKLPGSVVRPHSVARERVVQHLCSVADRSIRWGIIPQADERARSEESSYFGSVDGSLVFLDPELVSLPPEGVAGSADFLELLPESSRALYRTERKMKKEIEDKAPRAFLGISRGRYRELIARLEAHGLVGLQNEKPKVVNGVFGVVKDTRKHRLIIDARPANAVLTEPPGIKLPNPGHLADLSFQEEGPLYVCKSDMDNYYHRLCMPEWLHQYFGLPKVKIGGEEYWPVVRSLPMGWSHSVYIGQLIHEGLAERAGLSLDSSFQHSADPEVRDMRHGEYIDDFFALGSNPDLLSKSLSNVVCGGQDASLPAKPSKITRPDGQATTPILGMEVHSSGLITPSHEKFKSLLTFSMRVVTFRSWNTKLIEKLLGAWAWLLLLRRPLFSVFERIYECKDAKDGIVRPSRRMRQELFTVCQLSPLIFANIARRYGEVVVATDASKWGGGVVYTTIALDEVERVRTGDEAVTNFADNKEWKVAIRHQWSHTAPIHILEGEAVILGIRWLLRTSGNHGARFIFLVDNMALLGALRKGRSSKPAFNRICRKVAGLVLAGNLHLEYLYIRSVSNPADEPSRPVSPCR